MRASLLLIAALACGAWSAAASAQSPKAKATDPQIAAAREHYAFDAWPTGARRAGVALGAVAVPGHTGDAVDASAPGVVTRYYQGATKRPAFYVEAAVRETPAEAKQVLLETLAFVATPNPLPTLAASGIPAGDVGFVGYAGVDRTKISWIAFVRDNVAVRVMSADPTVAPQPDLPSVARAVDAAILATSKLADDAKLPRPKIAKLAASKDHCTAGENLILEVEVAADAAGAGAAAPILDWVVGGSGQGYVEKRADGR